MSESAMQRKPLAVKNGSRLPMLGSRLKPPTNFKRSRSPEEVKPRKRSRTESIEGELQPPKRLPKIQSSSSFKTSTILTKQPSGSKLTHIAAGNKKPKPSFSSNPAPKPVVGNGIKPKPSVSVTASRKPIAVVTNGIKSKPSATSRKPITVVGNGIKPKPSVSVASRKPMTGAVGKPKGSTVSGNNKFLSKSCQMLISRDAEVAQFKETVTTMEEKIEESLKREKNLEIEVEKYDQRIVELEQSVSESNQLLIRRNGEIAQFKETVTTVEDKIEESLKREKNLEIQVKECEQTNLEIEQSLASANLLIASRDGEISQLKVNLKTVEKELEESNKREQNLESEIHKCNNTIEQQKQSLASANLLIASRDGEISQLKVNLKTVEKELEESNKREHNLESEIHKCNNTIEQQKRNLDTASKTIVCRDEKISGLEESISKMQSQIADLKSTEQVNEMERRKLHNMVQELKGNIRVFCRVRPLLQAESYGHSGIIQHMNFPDPNQQILELDKCADMTLNESMLSSSRRGQMKYEFQFDRVFQPESSQAEVFDEISQLVQSALDGYNVCIFAYGQTGSGKTYTMEGPSVDDSVNCGMISRAVEQIFETARKLEDKGWKYEFKASMLEIYNESIRDLVEYHADKKHEIKLLGKDNVDTEVTDLTVITVKNEQQVHKLLKKASHNRAVAETKCNEHSSRSHSVFQLKLRGTNSITTETCSGILSLVDLAGSERLKESGSEGQRLKETLSINKSLSNLGNVIMALGNKDSHVPYRNSTLTYLLKNSLGGNSKTLMFVNVSPKEECFQETVSSLRFATKVNQCNIGTARKKAK